MVAEGLDWMLFSPMGWMGTALEDDVPICSEEDVDVDVEDLEAVPID